MIEQHNPHVNCYQHDTEWLHVLEIHLIRRFLYLGKGREMRLPENVIFNTTQMADYVGVKNHILGHCIRTLVVIPVNNQCNY
jgi:hypothetical protein